MSITVVAVFHPKPGSGPEIIDAFSLVSPLVHREAGCELYAAHLERGGDTVVMVERWASHEALEAHASGAPLRTLKELTSPFIERPYDVWFLDAVPLGEQTKGSIDLSSHNDSATDSTTQDAARPESGRKPA